MTATESIDIARFHACALRDLSDIILAKIEAGKHHECPNLLVLARHRMELVAATTGGLLPRPDANWKYRKAKLQPKRL